MSGERPRQSARIELADPHCQAADVPAKWQAVHAAAPQLAATMLAYVAQMTVSMRPSTVRAIDTDFRILARFLVDHDPALCGVADVERSHIETFKLWQRAQPGNSGQLKPATFRRRMGQLRTFFVRITEWGWHDAHMRVPIFFRDVPKRDEPLPRFLDNARFAQFMRALAAESRLPRRVAIELLARTGMRIGELCAGVCRPRLHHRYPPAPCLGHGRGDRRSTPEANQEGLLAQLDEAETSTARAPAGRYL